MPLRQKAEPPNEFLGTYGLRLLTSLVAIALWMPAIGLPVGPIWLQPLDFLILIAYPIILMYLPQIPKWSVIIALMSMFASTFAVLNGGDPMILLYYLVFILPFMMLIAMIASRSDTRQIFIKYFAIGGTFSLILFLLQVIVGAQALDFRTNGNFGLPEQYNRGFALFPEVSTFSTHAIYLLGVLIMFTRTKSVRRLFAFGRVGLLAILVVCCLVFTRSTSVLIVAPLVVAVAYFKGQQLSMKGIFGAVVLTLVATVFLQFYVENFYAERAASGGHRSAWLRGISIVSGLSILSTGEIFGVGLGNNHLISNQAIELARRVGFVLVLVPEGINSLIVSRIFEEGWPAAVLFGVAFSFLIRVWVAFQSDPYARAFCLLAVASMLVSLLVTGYRGIYMNWFWLAVAPALVQQTEYVRARTGDRRRAANGNNI